MARADSLLPKDFSLVFCHLQLKGAALTRPVPRNPRHHRHVELAAALGATEKKSCPLTRDVIPSRHLSRHCKHDHVQTETEHPKHHPASRDRKPQPELRHIAARRTVPQTRREAAACRQVSLYRDD